MRSIDESFYKSKTWQRVQASYRQRHCFCERCLKKGLYIPAKIVHHKKHLTKEDIRKPEFLYSDDNLESLCLDCHNKEHFGREKRYEIDGHGRLIITREE